MSTSAMHRTSSRRRRSEPDFEITTAEGRDIAPVGVTEEEMAKSVESMLAGLRGSRLRHRGSRSQQATDMDPGPGPSRRD